MASSRDIAGWLETQVGPELQTTSPGTTIVPPADDLDRALALLSQVASKSLLASVQLKPGAVIGEGGMGIIREAEQIALGRVVAIKTLKPGNRDPAAVRDLLREAWVSGSLEHPNVVPVHHLGLDDEGLPALVLKRVEGVEWSKLINNAAEVRRRFGVNDLLAWNIGILLQALNAIRFAHSRGVIHRDLKPSNVMIGDFGEVYVLDWGIAVSLRAESSGRLPLAAKEKQIAGTPLYMAPEMLQPDGEVPISERTDVYLAGAVLFEIIAARPPHAGKTAIAVMMSALTSKPELPPDTPEELAEICRRAMDPDPGARFESADAVRLALQSYLEHRSSEELAGRARLRAKELEAALAAKDREAIYKSFGACRFGFHEALAAWRDNAEARRGLRRATVAIAEYELSSGDPAAAVKLLGELDDPPPLLDEARAAAAEQTVRREKLEELGQAHDLQIGRRARAWMGFAMGMLFTITPQIPSMRMMTYSSLLTSTITVLVTVTALIWLLRRALGSTLVNRRLLASVIFLYVANSTLVAGAWALGVPPIHVHVMMVFLYFVISGLIALVVDLRLIPTALAFGAAFAFATLYPAYWMHAKSAGAFAFAINVMWAWWPAKH